MPVTPDVFDGAHVPCGVLAVKVLVLVIVIVISTPVCVLKLPVDAPVIVNVEEDVFPTQTCGNDPEVNVPARVGDEFDIATLKEVGP